MPVRILDGDPYTPVEPLLKKGPPADPDVHDGLTPAGARPSRAAAWQGRPHDGADAEARAAGGRGTSRAARAERRLPQRLRPVADRLTRAPDEVHRGAIDPKVGTAMAALGRALVAILEAGEFEGRLAALERRVAEERRPWPI